MTARQEARQRAAILALTRAERRLVAAFSRWQKLRDTVRRYDREADKADAAELERMARSHT